jgi:hypothetical protein
LLFQMCYGPEIPAIYSFLHRSPGCTKEQLRQQFQFQETGDITSLLEAVIVFLEELNFITRQSGTFETLENNWDDLVLLNRIHSLVNTEDCYSYNFVFASLYHHLFVQSGRLFLQDVHFTSNQLFPKTPLSREKVNAWKRMMEAFGLGYRVHSGFYALPQQRLIVQILAKCGYYDGPLHAFCETHVNPYIPCLHNGRVYDGIMFGLAHAHSKNRILLSQKQDLPSPSYGPEKQWNWITI